MAKTHSKRSGRKTVRHHIKTYDFFLVFTALLGMIAGVLLARTFYDARTADERTTVNLGAVQYDFSSGKAVKRDTPAVSSLRTFLTQSAAKDCAAIRDDEQPTQYQVIAANKDVSQVLVGYGCGNTNAHMFAVRHGETWSFISPTNQFDALLGVSKCEYVDQQKIDKSIAPVCYEVKNDAMTYRVR